MEWLILARAAIRILCRIPLGEQRQLLKFVRQNEESCFEPAVQILFGGGDSCSQGPKAPDPTIPHPWTPPVGPLGPGSSGSAPHWTLTPGSPTP